MKYISRFLAGAALLCALAGTGRADRYANIQPAYNAQENALTLRIEGETGLGNNASFYGFMDVDAKKEENTECYFGMGRVSWPFSSRFSLMAQYEIASGSRDLIRPGIQAAANIGGHVKFKARLFPYETTGLKGPQLHLLGTQSLGNLELSEFGAYNTRSRTWYVEPEIDFKISPRVTAFVRGRGSGAFEKLCPEEDFGVRMNF